VARSSGGHRQGDGDDEFPSGEIGTAITVRSLLAAAPVIPSVADEGEEEAEAVTALNPVPSSSLRPRSETLPDFVQASLEVIGGGEPRTFVLTTTHTIIGRFEKADVRLGDVRASRKHACVLYAGTEFRIRDEGSGNGTLLNGSPVKEYALRDGDKLLIGETLLRFSVTSRSR
jgi:hypothetical protein